MVNKENEIESNSLHVYNRTPVAQINRIRNLLMKGFIEVEINNFKTMLFLENLSKVTKWSDYIVLYFNEEKVYIHGGENVNVNEVMADVIYNYINFALSDEKNKDIEDFVRKTYRTIERLPESEYSNSSDDMGKVFDEMFLRNFKSKDREILREIINKTIND